MVFKYILVFVFIIKNCNCGGVALESNGMKPYMKQIDERNENVNSDIKVFSDYPCKNNMEVISYFMPGLKDGYTVRIHRNFNINDVVHLNFDLQTYVTTNGIYFTLNLTENATLELGFRTSTMFAQFQVRSTINVIPAYLVSVKINGEEICNYPNKNYFINHPVGALNLADCERYCGRRANVHNQLIFRGIQSKPGLWPWHTALYGRKNGKIKYQCGGTLLINKYVITAAHCVTVRGQAILPENLAVFLGKFNLIDDDNSTTQEIEVEKVIVHEQFKYRKLDDDIALIKLKTQPVLNEYVSSACLWYDGLKQRLDDEIVGTVIGWGYHNETYSLSNNLREATMPIVSDLTCMRSKPTFFPPVLANEKKFCAGYHNGTSACNGDSGGGMFVYVPYSRSNGFNEVQKLGGWYLKGIVSLSVSGADAEYLACDPNEYVVFTDVAKYGQWIKKNIM